MTPKFFRPSRFSSKDTSSCACLDPNRNKPTDLDPFHPLGFSL